MAYGSFAYGSKPYGHGQKPETSILDKFVSVLKTTTDRTILITDPDLYLLETKKNHSILDNLFDLNLLNTKSVDKNILTQINELMSKLETKKEISTLQTIHNVNTLKTKPNINILNTNNIELTTI